jgi:glutathione S-transferase
MLKLYDYLPSGNGYKVRLLLRLLQRPYVLVERDILRGETRTPDFLRLNPNGRVPVLELEDGTCLAESDAILFYLAEGTPYLPDSRLERAQVLQWMFFEQYSHEPNIATTRFWLKHPELLDDARRAQLPGKRALGYAALDVMEGRLAAAPYFVGGRFSIADIALYGYTHVAEEAQFDLQRYPAIRAWLARVRDRPGYLPITER